MGSRSSSSADQVAGATLGLDDRQFAVFDAGARHGASTELAGGPSRDRGLQGLAVRASSSSPGTSRMTIFCSTVVPDATAACCLCEIGDLIQHASRRVARRWARRPRRSAVDLWVHADVVASLGWCLGRGPVDKLPLQVLGLNTSRNFSGPPVGHEELDARPVAQAAVAVVPEHAR